MNKRLPLPKRYWLYLIIVLVCMILLVGNIYRTDNWTGDKPFSEFSHQDWQLLIIFFVEEVIIATVMLLFAFLCRRLGKERNVVITVEWENNYLDLGIKPGDYDYVWFNFAKTERAVIVKYQNTYNLFIHEFDKHTAHWEYLSGLSVYDSLEAVKRALFYEFNFHCEENTVLDKNGNEIFRES